MTETKPQKSPNVWFAIDRDRVKDPTLAPYTLQLKGGRSLNQAIADDDWVLILDTTGHITRVGRILRIRSDLETTTIFFDRMLQLEPSVSIGMTSLRLPATGSSGRIQWTDFIAMLPSVLHKSIAEIPRIAQTLNILDPITFPTAIPGLPSNADCTLTSNSGALVPNATTVKPTTKGDIPKRTASDELPFTRKSAPK